MSRTDRRIDVLKRRRDHVAARARHAPYDADYDRAEVAALNMAIRVLENARSLGIVDDLASLSVFELAIVQQLGKGRTMDEVADALGVSRWRIRDHARRLCRIYECSMHELPDAIASAGIDAA